MNGHRGFPFYQEFSNLLHLDLFHAVSGCHDYNNVHSFPFNVFCLCLESTGGDGVFTQMDEQKDFIARPNEAVFIPSGTRVRYFAKKTYNFIAMHFNLTFLSGIDLFEGDHEIRSFRDEPVLREIRDIFNIEGRESLRNAVRLESLILRICSNFLPAEIDETRLASEIKNREVFRFIRDHLSAELKISRIAAFLNTAPDTFSHRFSTEIGISPKEFIQKELARESGRELMKTNLSIKEVAEKFQFRSEFYFSTFFRRRTGMSPVEYRAHFRELLPHPEK